MSDNDRNTTDWRARSVDLANALLSLAETAGMPDTYVATDSRTTLARETLEEAGQRPPRRKRDAREVRIRKEHRWEHEKAER